MAADRDALTLDHLSLRQRVAQLLMPRVGGEFAPLDAPSMARARAWVQDSGVGGLIIGIGPPLEIAAKLNALQQSAAVPLLVAADMEHGPGQVLNGGVILPHGFQNGGGTRFPPLMGIAATGDERFAYELGRITAIEARAAGVHVAFAPVVDVNSNPANPIINTRSYGADPEQVGRFAAAHVRGLQENGMLATAKHFPGHGDTSTDSHVRLPVLGATRDHFDAIELPPFRRVIGAGVAGIMSAHIAYPALTGDESPATLSARMLTGLLREELGFDGLVFTDGLDMGAITGHYGSETAALRALAAGADILLQPAPEDVDAIIDAIVNAVRSGAIAEERVNASVLRVLRAKERLGLQRGAVVDLDAVPGRVGVEVHQAVAREAAARAIAVVRNHNDDLPLRAQRPLVIVYGVEYDPFRGRAFIDALEALGRKPKVVRLDPASTAAAIRAAVEMADAADAVIFAPFTRIGAGNPSIGVAPEVVTAVETVMARRPTVIMTFGNPYILSGFPKCDTYVVAWAPWEPLQTAAARALLGCAPVTGCLPIPLPPHHSPGEGVEMTGAVQPC